MLHMGECYLFDLDGTLADCSHRLHHIKNSPKDWRAFFKACIDDAPIKHMVDLAQQLEQSGVSIVYVSGRSDEVRHETLEWLSLYRLPDGALYMRKAGDFRADDVVKLELLQQIRADGWRPIMAFDDRDRVVKMWRANGVPCAQVAEGDF
jgi:phosphoglycolate phosphatase-like HAD superfamily hydrolase